MGPDLRRASALLPLAIVVVVAAVLIATSRPGVPGLRDPIAKAVPVGPIASDLPSGDVDPEAPPEGPRSPSGQACLDRITRGDGWVDLCWSVTRDPHDADPTKDYYLLRFYGSHQGLRFLAVKSDLAGSPGDGVVSLWPTGTIEGPCEVREVHLSGYLGTLPPANVCGTTVGELVEVAWSHTLTWSCEGCALGETNTRAFDTFVWVGVPAHTIPTWDLFADASA
jgi:hypothetical protein